MCLSQSKEIRSTLSNIQRTQAQANKQLVDAEAATEAEIRRVMETAAEETPEDPLGKAAIAKIRARFEESRIKMQEQAAAELAASKVALQEQLKRRRDRFAKRKARDARKQAAGLPAESDDVVQARNLKRALTPAEEAARIHENFAEKEARHKRDLQRSHTRSKDTLQRLLAKRRKKLARREKHSRKKHAKRELQEQDDRNGGDSVGLASPAGSSRSERRRMAEQRKQLQAAEEIEARKAAESAADLQEIDELLAKTKRSSRKAGRGVGRMSAVSSESKTGSISEDSKGATAEEATASAASINSQVENLAQKALAERRKLKLLEQISRAARTDASWTTPSTKAAGAKQASSTSDADAEDGAMVVHDLEELDDDDEAGSTLSYLAHRARKAW